MSLSLFQSCVCVAVVTVVPAAEVLKGGGVQKGEAVNTAGSTMLIFFSTTHFFREPWLQACASNGSKECKLCVHLGPGSMWDKGKQGQ